MTQARQARGVPAVARELQERVLYVLGQAMSRRVYDGPTPIWLQRPDRVECGRRWTLVRRVYAKLSDGLVLPPEMPLRESRTVDGLIGGRGRVWQLVEVDESQHFNAYRSMTLRMYPKDLALGFPTKEWIAGGGDRIPTAGGGWDAPRRLNGYAGAGSSVFKVRPLIEHFRRSR